MDSLVCSRRFYLALGGADPLAMPLHILSLFPHGDLLKKTCRAIGFFQGAAPSRAPVEGAAKDWEFSLYR